MQISRQGWSKCRRWQERCDQSLGKLCCAAICTLLYLINRSAYNDTRAGRSACVQICLGSLAMPILCMENVIATIKDVCVCSSSVRHNLHWVALIIQRPDQLGEVAKGSHKFFGGAQDNVVFRQRRWDRRDWWRSRRRRSVVAIGKVVPVGVGVVVVLRASRAPHDKTLHGRSAPERERESMVRRERERASERARARDREGRGLISYSGN
eukprot:3294494-Pleurochrysis_carterae.AAC.9